MDRQHISGLYTHEMARPGGPPMHKHTTYRVCTQPDMRTITAAAAAGMACAAGSLDDGPGAAPPATGVTTAVAGAPAAEGPRATAAAAAGRAAAPAAEGSAAAAACAHEGGVGTHESDC